MEHIPVRLCPLCPPTYMFHPRVVQKNRVFSLNGHGARYWDERRDGGVTDSNFELALVCYMCVLMIPNDVYI